MVQVLVFSSLQRIPELHTSKMAFRALILLAVVGTIQCKVLSLSCQQIRAFVDGHNNRRENLVQGKVSGQPAASEMKYMIWDKELAAKAAKWASQWRTMHNPDRTVGSGRFTTGENLYWYWTSDHAQKLDVKAPLDSWFDEHVDYTYGSLSASDFAQTKQIGHYTQMAWSDSVYVGCAIAQYTDDWNKFFVVCNYGPAGNILGRKPYPSGSPGEKLTCSLPSCSQPYGDQCSQN